MSAPILYRSVRSCAPNAPAAHYCGRACAGWRASALGNPNRAVPGQPGATLPAYREHLRAVVRAGLAGQPSPAYDELLALARRHAQGQPLTLACWCPSMDTCHTSIVRDAIAWLAAHLPA
jgi:hypothetical protein